MCRLGGLERGLLLGGILGVRLMRFVMRCLWWMLWRRGREPRRGRRRLVLLVMRRAGGVIGEGVFGVAVGLVVGALVLLLGHSFVSTTTPSFPP